VLEGVGVKPILRLVNVFPLFLGVLILGSLWKLFWGSFVMPRVSSDSFLAKFAGAALLQWGVILCLSALMLSIMIL
jgi:hypothetical protein